MSLADYLAKNYLTADPQPAKKSKKRKRKAGEESGLIIADDDPDWGHKESKDGDDDGPLTVTADSAEFRKSRKSTWRTVGAPTPQESDQVAADAIVSATAAENALHTRNPEDAPVVVPMMESGAHAGLQTAEQVTTAVNRRRADELRRFHEQDSSELGRGTETIYRDASGRIINIAMKRAEARRKAAEDVAAAAAEEEAQKGAVQLAARAQRKQDLQDAKLLPVARYADDADLNQDLKARERWNDPAAAFLSSKKDGRSVTGKPLYKGPAAPNRYGIRPGHRWDGVDRGNGFEGEWFAARNRRANQKGLEYAWQMDE
ncbi:MAG: Pre-mRNA-splicing factor cwc26 [Geoglossum umbratile]|nr:MAG: Pre-mRNA-splicing factor cwc26 [Geoglossum umbratile]